MKKNQEESAVSRSCLDFNHNLFINPVWSLKKLVPVIILIIYSFLGGLIFYLLEKDTECQFDYWTALFYAGTIYTTIGYGTVVACSTAGRFVTIIYALFGIPLTLVVLDNLGQLLAALANAIWTELSCCCCCCGPNNIIKKCHLRGCFFCCTRKNQKLQPEHPSDDGEVDVETMQQTIPLWLAMLLLIFWFLLSSLYFYMMETDWYFGEAVYFMAISVLTIGFGDYAPETYNYAVMHMFFLLVGLSLFSMCVNLVQQNTSLLAKKILRGIAQEYKKSLEQQYQGRKPVERKESLESTMKKKGGVLWYFMPDKTKTELIREYETKSRMRVVGTQTEIRNTQSIGILAKPIDFRPEWSKKF